MPQESRPTYHTLINDKYCGCVIVTINGRHSLRQCPSCSHIDQPEFFAEVESLREEVVKAHCDIAYLKGLVEQHISGSHN